MSGAYTTRSTKTSYPSISYRTGFLGEPGETQSVDVFAPSTKSVFSYRTVRGSGAEDAAIAEDRRIFRNGFATHDPRYDRGHEFWTSDQYVEPTWNREHYVRWSRRGSNYFYRGPIPLKMEAQGRILPPKSFYPTLDATPVGEWSQLGQRALLGAAPTAPQANAAVFLGELLAGLPQMVGAALWRDKALNFRNAGGEYLNVQFGWLPFVSDIQKAAEALKKSTAILRQLERDNGRMVRRRFRFPTSLDSSESTFAGYNGPWETLGTNAVQSWVKDSQTTVISRTARDAWFAGAFSYAIPQDESLLGRLSEYEAKANVLLGTRVTPEVLWELAPWSWLVDWKAGIGRTISAATRFSEDGLVIRYAYLMVHTIKEVSFHHPGAYTLGFGDRIPALHQLLRSERKERFRATPYGFGLNTESFTDQQWSILTALGMTKAPKKLF